MPWPEYPSSFTGALPISGEATCCPTLRPRHKTWASSNAVTGSARNPQQVVLEHYRQADLFVLNSQVDPNGDRDGLPNVIVEAQSQSLAVLSTNISGIPELIKNGRNGVLVDQRNNDALTTALIRLIKAPDIREELGRRGNRRVRKYLDKDVNIRQLHKLFAQYGPT